MIKQLAVTAGALGLAVTGVTSAQAQPAQPHTTTITVPMHLVGYDPAVAKAHGYVIKKDAQGLEYSVKAGANPQTIKPNNTIPGDCGTEPLSSTGEAPWPHAVRGLPPSPSTAAAPAPHTPRSSRATAMPSWSTAACATAEAPPTWTPSTNATSNAAALRLPCQGRQRRAVQAQTRRTAPRDSPTAMTTVPASGCTRRAVTPSRSACIPRKGVPSISRASGTSSTSAGGRVA